MALKKPQKSLKKWTKQKWGTKSGKSSTQGPKATGERYLPKKAREALSAKEYAATSRKKRADTRKGKQHSAQPKKIAKKTYLKDGIAVNLTISAGMSGFPAHSDSIRDLIEKADKAMYQTKLKGGNGVSIAE